MNHLVKQLSTLSARNTASSSSRQINAYNFLGAASKLIPNNALNPISGHVVRPLSFTSGGIRFIESLGAWNNSMLPCTSNNETIKRANCDIQVRFRSNRSRRGLYDGKDIVSGNSVTFSGKKVRRKFKPNVFKKRLYSEILDTMIRFHVTTSALRSIDKVGGLDNYLLSSEHVQEGEGMKIKKMLLGRLKMIEFNNREVPQVDVVEK